MAAGLVLVLPWLGLTLSPSLSAWHLTFSLGAVPLLHHISYGIVLAALSVGAVVSFIRAGWRVTRVTRAVGWAYLALALVFLVTTRLADTATMFGLQSDASQSAIINIQFLSKYVTTAPTQFLGVSFDTKTLILLYGLRMGWYLLVVAGVALGREGRTADHPPAVAGRRGGRCRCRRRRRGPGAHRAGPERHGQGIQAVATGRPGPGRSCRSAPCGLDPEIAYDPGLQQALGQAQPQQGRTTALADYAEAVRPAGRDLTLLEQAQLFAEAAAALPAGSPAGRGAGRPGRASWPTPPWRPRTPTCSRWSRRRWHRRR